MQSSSNTQRLYYFDILKGLAIFMVVVGHVITMCIRGIDRAPLFKFIAEIHMPLFFFISGWFTFKLTGNNAIAMPRWGKRACQLLLPMAVCSTLWIWYFPHSGLQSPLVSTFAGLWSDPWKNGYWFTLVLFEILLLYAASAPLLRLCRRAATAIAVVAVAWIALLLAAEMLVPLNIANCLSLDLTASFYFPFMLGAIARRHAGSFGRLVQNQWAIAVAMVATGVLLYFVCWYWEFAWAGPFTIAIARGLLHTALAIAAIAVVKPWSDAAYASGNPKTHPWARMWQYLGTQSLAVYLLHYFFLFPLGFAAPWLETMGLAFAPTLAVATAAAALITALTLAAAYIIGKSKPLSTLLLGA